MPSKPKKNHWDMDCKHYYKSSHLPELDGMAALNSYNKATQHWVIHLSIQKMITPHNYQQTPLHPEGSRGSKNSVDSVYKIHSKAAAPT